MTLTIRTMLIDDIDAVHSIELIAHRSPWSHQILKECVLVGYDCRVLELNDSKGSKLIGYIIARYTLNSCHILNLCIANDQQSKGYGKHLLEEFLHSLKRQDVETIYLEVRPSNLPALSLYSHFGFVQIDLKEDYYVDKDQNKKEDAIVLAKVIL